MSSKPSRWSKLWTVLLWLVLLLTVLLSATCWWLSMTPTLLGSVVWFLGPFLLVPALSALLLGVFFVRGLTMRKVDLTGGLAVVVAIFSGWPVFFQGQLAYPVSVEAAGPSIAMHLPLKGEVMVGWGGDYISTNYHAYVPPQRWAYDLMKQPAFTGSEHLEDYGCYGVTVIAPSAGTIVYAKDGELDNTPGRFPESTESLMGNSIGLRLAEAPDVVVFIAHLKKGSVRVRKGQKVRAGQPIGRCGNSGNTTEPHVHIHAERDPAIDYPDTFGQVGVPVPMTFFLEGGVRMPMGGEGAETVRADPDALPQKDLAVPLNPVSPWSVAIRDGNGNLFRFQQESEGEASFVYDPITPLESSSGTYSGGAPKEGVLSVDQREALWRWIHALAGEKERQLVDEQPKGSLVVSFEIPAGKRDFVMDRSAMTAERMALLESYRGTSTLIQE